MWSAFWLLKILCSSLTQQHHILCTINQFDCCKTKMCINICSLQKNNLFYLKANILHFFSDQSCLATWSHLSSPQVGPRWGEGEDWPVPPPALPPAGSFKMIGNFVLAKGWSISGGLWWWKRMSCHKCSQIITGSDAKICRVDNVTVYFRTNYTNYVLTILYNMPICKICLFVKLATWSKIIAVIM